MTGIIVGGQLPGVVEWQDDSIAIVRCDHPHPEIVYEAACHDGADLADLYIEPLSPGVWRIGPAPEDPEDDAPEPEHTHQEDP